VLGHGRGGHFHSLNQISKEIGKQLDVRIVLIGPGKSDILESNPYFLEQIHFNGVSLLSLRKNILSIIKKITPDIIHCFDEHVFNVVNFVLFDKRIRVVLNKCGGANPQNFPRVESIILFSRENERWFRNNKKFRGSNVYLIPNRVTPIRVCPYPEFRRAAKSFTFVRISRIGSYYKESLIDSINLIRELASRGITNARLLIIGVVQEPLVFEELKCLASKIAVSFLTDSKYTMEASRLLYLADAVIGTGRGVMEATSLGIPVLVPARNSKIPVLLKEENIDGLFETNFSQRGVVVEETLSKNMESICEIIRQEALRKRLGSFLQAYFEEKFSAANAGDKYLTVYRNASFNKGFSNVLDLRFRVRSLYAYFRNRNQSYLK